jgi:tetrahydromethanopterin S-methyltransferase subunit F
VDDDCCGRICIRQMVVSHRDIKLSEEDLRDRIQLFDRQRRSPNRMLVTVSSGRVLGKVCNTF